MNIISKYKLEDLAEKLCQKIVESAKSGYEDPFNEYLIVTQSHVMNAYIMKKLADISGIAANIRFLYPRNALFYILENCGVDVEKIKIFYDSEILTWKIYEIMPELETKYRVLREYIEDNSKSQKNFESGELKRYKLSREIALIFDIYIGYRGEWLELWQEGKRVKHDSTGKNLTLGEHEEWQAELWRKITVEAKTKIKFKKFSSLLKENIKKFMLRSIKDIAIFGISGLPEDFINFFKILDTAYLSHISRKDTCKQGIEFYYITPCIEFWGDISKTTASIENIANPLLASWGGVGKDFFNLILSGFDNTLGGDEENFLISEQKENLTVLRALQKDILKNVPMTDSLLSSLTLDDSIVINSCHNPMREVEILYDYIIDILENNRSIDVSDIVVMSPDIEKYAPYIRAVFESNRDFGEAYFGNNNLYTRNQQTNNCYIPFSIEDCSPLSTSPYVETFVNILHVITDKITAEDVFKIISSEPVTKKFDISSEEVSIIHDLISKANIAWGKDKTHKQFVTDLKNLSNKNSWEFGFNRLLAGCVFDSDYVTETDFQDQEKKNENQENFVIPVPLDEQKSLCLGKLIEISKLIFKYHSIVFNYRKLSEESFTPYKWHEILMKMIDDFFIIPEKKIDEISYLHNAVNSLAETWESAKINKNIPLQVVINALEYEFTSATEKFSNFFRGKLTFCRLLPMRNIPFKFICLIGMDEGKFPSQDINRTFDLSGYSPRLGDRSKRKDDKYIFLETIMACREKLYISYIGKNPQDNEPLPPSLLVTELIDYLINTMNSDTVRYTKEDIVTEHPLHPFDPKYFLPEQKKFFSYSQINFEAAKSVITKNKALISTVEKQKEKISDSSLFCSSKLQISEKSLEFSFDDFVSFFLCPSKFFLKYRLNIYLYEETENELWTSEPLDISALDRYNLKKMNLEHRLSDKPGDFIKIIKTTGQAPETIQADYFFKNITIEIDNCIKKIKQYGRKAERPLIKKFTVEGSLCSLTFSGTIENLYHSDDDHIIQLFYKTGRLKHKDKVRVWLWHQIASRIIPEKLKKTVLISSVVEKRGKPHIYEFENKKTEEHCKFIEELAEVFYQGLTQPLPLFIYSSPEWARRSQQEKKIPDEEELLYDIARNNWENNKYDRNKEKDSCEQSNIICFGEEAPFLKDQYKNKFKELSHLVYKNFYNDIQNNN